MTERNIIALPVDGRPVTREQVQLLGRIAGCEVLCPAVSELGYFREPADRNALARWLREQAPQADGFIFSVDMLVYGGLVPSRFIDDGAAALIERLQLLRELRTRYPDKPIYGFCATMRLSNNNENEEEKLYWSEYGELIWRWSYHSDRFECLGEEEDQKWASMAKALIPEDIRRDYLDTRARNFTVTEQVLKLVADGVIDRLILPQDDTAEYGFNIAERRRLQARVASHGLDDRVLIYPGADEVIYTLLAHQLQGLGAAAPVRLALSLHQPHSIAGLVARYEDRPLLESIRSQIAAAGAVLVEDIDSADAVIAVHSRGSAQGDWAMQAPLPDPEALDERWLSQLAAINKPVALLDLAYANGGDPQLLAGLPIELSRLLAYAAWNTASNSIGSLVAQVCLALGANSGNSADTVHSAHNRHLLAIRLLDDYLYQAEVRQALRRQHVEKQTDPQTLLQSLKALYLQRARQWLRQQQLAEIELEDIYLPWQRSFEIGLRTSLVGDSAGGAL
ncbi:hypothetical protein Maes01_02077 [Microbulbifer aestuariivivens]|uniref:DUF4127 family protein n=1 Tax=Microbulbifer aestuariivivens TaxID=1908308 RepID=A0ABP9WQN1_9GAMM